MAGFLSSTSFSAPQLLGPDGQTVESAAPPALDAGTDFGNRAPGSATTHTFTLRNTGEEPLDITGNRMRGGRRFMANMSTTLIQPGASHAFDVTFRPDTPSVHTGELQIFIADHDPVVIHLAGSSFSVDPNRGPLEGDNRITIEGDFPDGVSISSVKVAGQHADFRHGGGLLRRNRDRLTVTVPAANQAGPAHIVIETEEHGTLTLSAAYEFINEDEEDR